MRRTLQAILSLLLLVWVVACAAPPAASPTTSAPGADATPPAASAPTAPAAASAAAQPGGELRILVGIHFPATLDAVKDGFTLIFLGMGEGLMRLTPEQKLTPWLAESLTNINPTTWEVKLRQGVTFWDGSTVTADAVADSFKRSWEQQPAATRFIDENTTITVKDPQTLVFQTPTPAGDFPSSLATQYFVIHKPGKNGSIMTGPYRPTSFEKDKELLLEGFTGYWGGMPKFKQITVKLAKDANARALALQAGDADMLYGLPPEIVTTFGPEIETVVQPSTRVHSILLNHSRLPFSDKAVREATALAIDRAALNKVALDGRGAPVTNLFPANTGVEVVDAQATDVARAQQLLDGAGWALGADGVRAKDGQRLAFTLYSYPGRAELTPMAVAIQGQLKPLGYDVQIQQVDDITAFLNQGDFDASMMSFNTTVTGDPQYLFALTMVSGADWNKGKYNNPQMDTLFNELRVETDPARRQAISRQMQEIVKADVPGIYLVAAPLVIAYRKDRVSNFVFHPNDLYFIDNTLTGR